MKQPEGRSSTGDEREELTERDFNMDDTGKKAKRLVINKKREEWDIK
jgi:hypothetical protein